VAIDTIVNQKEFYAAGKPVFCIYVAIGQKASTVASVAAALEKAGAESTLKFYEGISHAGIVLALSTWRRKTAPVLADAAAFMRDKAR
jgi:hypothetical protein